MVAVGSLLFGQTQTGTITGTVTDETGAVLPGVTVTLTSPDMLGTRTAVTTERGHYQFMMLPPGFYEIKFELEGFTLIERQEIRITIGFVARIDVTMTIAALEETITVTGESPVVDVKSVLKSTTFDSSMLDNLPSGRDPWSAAAMAPGVQPGLFNVAGTESFQQYDLTSHGGSDSQKSFNIDGLNTNWPGLGGGAVMIYYAFGMYKEMAFQTNALPAEVGEGGVYINMVTDSGGNEFHGDYMMLFMNQNLSAANISPEQEAAGIIANPIDLSWDNNANFGGPLIKDKAWFFSSLRYWRMDIVMASAFTAPGKPVRLDDNMMLNLFGKATYQINPRNTFMYNWNRNYKYRYHRGSLSVYEEDEATALQDQIGNSTQGQWTSIISDRAFLDVRLGYMFGTWPMHAQKGITDEDIQKQDIDLNTRWNAADDYMENPNYRLQLNASYSYFVDEFMAGSHSLKTGFVFSHQFNGRDYWTNKYGIYYQRYRSGVPVDVRLSNLPVHMECYLDTYGLYVQDDYTLKDRITLSLGLRFNRFFGYIPAHSSPAGAFFPERSTERIDGIPEWNVLSPRLGFSYDLFGDGKTAIKGSYSRYYHQPGTSMQENVNPMTTGRDTRTWTDLDGDDFADLNELGPSTGWRLGTKREYDPNTRSAHEDEFTLGVERELFTDFNLGVTFYYRTYRDGWGSYNVLLRPEYFTPVTVDNPLGGTLTVWNILPEYRTLYQAVYANNPLYDRDYRGLELTWTKRYSKGWQLMGGLTIQRDYGGLGGDPNDPNSLIFNEGHRGSTSPYIFKMVGSYLLPYDIMFSGHYRYMTGYPSNRYLYIYGFNQGTFDVRAVEQGKNRLEDNNLLDLRLSKLIHIKDYTLELMFDLYNSFNSNNATQITTTIGPRLGMPVKIITPRTARIGVKFSF